MSFLEGYLVGLGMIIFIGPVFFLLLSSTLKCGFTPGLMVALGIICSDIVCVLICNYGLVPFINYSDSNFWIALVGGILLIGLGIKYLQAKKIDPEKKVELPHHYHIAFFTKGFFVNFVNPFVFMVWIGLVKFTERKTGLDSTLFFSGTLLGIFTTDFLKVALAKRIKDFIKPNILQLIFRICGVVLIVFGLRMILYFYFK